MSVFETEISEEVYHQNYRYGDDRSIEDTWRRTADYLASVEEDQEKWENNFYRLLSGDEGMAFPFTPGGRILANAGTGLDKASLINCFVSGARGYDQDSMDEIQDELTRQAKILASEGGYGFCASFMRPRGARIGGVGSMTPGAVKMLDMWNEQAATIVAGSGMKSDRDDVKNKIRKGAQMVTMHVWHPDIIEFIEAKQETGRLHKFNMSVLATDEFMEAVRNDEKWALRYPAYEEEPEFYKENWNGDIHEYEEKGGTVKTWIRPDTREKAIYDAREIWEKIMESTYNRNEPGVLFIDTINKENNLNYTERIDATNPCQPGYSTLRTPNGLKKMEDIEEGDVVWSEDQWVTVINKQKTGVRPVYKYETTAGTFYSTEDHRIKEHGEKVEIQHADEIDLLKGSKSSVTELDQQAVLDGLMIGDGSYHNASSDPFYLNIGETDYDYFDDPVSEFIGESHAAHHGRANKVNTTLNESDLCELWNREVPDRYFFSHPNKVASFLRGLYSANGSICAKRVTLKTTSKDLVSQVQEMLSSIGIRSYYTVNKPSVTEHRNGEYKSRKSYDINITTDRNVFFDKIGFIQEYKMDKLRKIIENTNSRDRRKSHEIRSVEYVGDQTVYDITVDGESHTYWTHGFNSSNCGEQVLPIGGVCLLGNLNVTQFVRDGEIDYNLLESYIPSAVRFLDNVNDLTYVPFERQQQNLQQKRRIGLGHYGIGSALVMMKQRYGSNDAYRTARRFQKFLANKAYQASAKLAKEKEPFPLFDKDHYLNESPVVQRLSDKTKEMIGDLGLRNSHLLSIQPTGNTSTLANAPSSGIEPVFMHSYVRTSEQGHLPDEIDEDADHWEEEEQGDETVLRCTKEGYKHWQIHPTRGYVKDSVVEDYAKRNMEDFDADAEWAPTTRDLDVDDHLTMMRALAPFVDSAMSKTVNIPNDYPFEDFKDLYMNAHETGVIKGLTTYRAGTMSAVLSGEDDGDDLPRTEAPERPRELECAVHKIRYRGDNWKILVGFYEDKPYEVFAFTTDGEVRLVDSEGKAFDRGTIRKVDSGKYQLVAPDGKVVLDDITEHAPDENVREETRLVSTALRHGAQIDFLIEQLEKAEGSVVSFGKSMARALKAHGNGHTLTCDKCGSENVRHVEGCMTCADCGHSKCS